MADPTVHPNPLASHYTRFRVAERLLLTGHSHQAWPDVAFRAQQEAWLEAAHRVDDKWERAFQVAEEVRAGVRALLDDPTGEVALGQNTLELVGRFLSALPLRERPRLVASDGEFHTVRRLLDRLAEEGVEVVRVPALPASGLSERLADRVDGRTAAVLVSSVLYESGHRVPHLGELARRCRDRGAELLVDAYHSVNVVPLSLGQEGLEEAFVVGGGYKYLQWGEGCCFLRFPRDCALRPVLTGWFSEFGVTGDADLRAAGGRVPYGGGSARFAGSTYDPTAHYRAAAVLAHFQTLGLGVEVLRGISLHQVARLESRFREGAADPGVLRLEEGVPAVERGGFLVLRSPRAGELVRILRTLEVLADSRGDALRLGPAPYLSDAQLDEAMARVVEAARRVG